MFESTFEINLNKKQSQKFAQAIFADIEKYIAEHQTEFEEFLREEEKNLRRKNNS